MHVDQDKANSNANDEDNVNFFNNGNPSHTNDTNNINPSRDNNHESQAILTEKPNKNKRRRKERQNATIITETKVMFKQSANNSKEVEPPKSPAYMTMHR